MNYVSLVLSEIFNFLLRRIVAWGTANMRKEVFLYIAEMAVKQTETKADDKFLAISREIFEDKDDVSKSTEAYLFFNDKVDWKEAAEKALEAKLRG